MPRLLLIIALLALVGPARGQDAKLVSRIAFGSCVDQDKPVPIFDTIAFAKPDLLLLLGDNMYADLDKKVKVTPDVIRAKYRQMEAVPAFARLRSACPILGIWDDHDYGRNDAGAEWEHKDEAQQALLDFFGVAKDDPRRKRRGVYHAAVFGPVGRRVQVILLDTRYHRSPIRKAPADPRTRIAAAIPNTDPGATFLGKEQWTWLEEQLKQPAELRLLVSSIQVVAEEHPFEKWANIPAERARLYKLLERTAASGVIVLSGDRHHGEISLDSTALSYPLYDVTASGFNQAFKNWRAPEKNLRRVATFPYGDHFGLITIDWSAPDPRIVLAIRDDEGDTACSVKLRLSDLKSRGASTASKLPAGVLAPAEAAKKVGERVTVQFEVQSAGGKGNIFLNTDKDFRAEGNFTVVLRPTAQTGPWAKAAPNSFVGRTIRATGTIRLYKESPQLEVTAEKDLLFVEK